MIYQARCSGIGENCRCPGCGLRFRLVAPPDSRRVGRRWVPLPDFTDARGSEIGISYPERLEIMRQFHVVRWQTADGRALHRCGCPADARDYRIVERADRSDAESVGRLGRLAEMRPARVTAEGRAMCS